MIDTASGDAARARRAREIDERMAFLVTQKNKIVGEMILLVHELERDRLFRALGATSVTDYMRRRARWEPSKTTKVVALARKLADLPHLREAVVRGDVGWTTAYEAAKGRRPRRTPTGPSWHSRSPTSSSRPNAHGPKGARSFSNSR
jgi:hypothetical protein